jgi:hypothetical protein
VLNSTLVDSGAFHTNEEMILVIDEENEHVLAQSIFLRGHVVLGMR